MHEFHANSREIHAFLFLTFIVILIFQREISKIPQWYLSCLLAKTHELQLPDPGI